MATGLLNYYNMVWEVKTKEMPNALQTVQLVMETRPTVINEPLEMLKCNEHLPLSPGYESSDDHMELDDLPELQAVQTDSTSPEVFHLDTNVSHQEYTVPWNENSSNMSENEYSCDNGINWLTELANIATSPQSPLMQCSFYNRSSPVHIIATSKSLHSYARPPPTESEPSFTKNHWKEEQSVRHERAHSESESGIFCMSSFSDDDDLGWCNSWPHTAWHCFLKGTRLCFHKGRKKIWQDVEDFAKTEHCRNESGYATATFKSALLLGIREPSGDSASREERSLQPSRPTHADTICFGISCRAISVILGEMWKKMKNEERRIYTIEAKALAEEQKRLNPDCWKRKRTNSGSQQH
ncbi:HMG box-containing protein 1 [Bombina bombina]|uniref:HMG box-containing protein 1 n=1 Tax=Bombina bombina TaxID=8345 RepID=UPI00235A8B5B|nr:HMG box-containing protein 1 [Bombina bombina]